ncbi:hypothetical protein ADIWIN_1257 [Winogradskyella psychrotolerans RS-3]|uniref:Uncharacterized protein n=1 Tax=Winogradskyella psychrotolerans RS-3 TaxID=641526 RepID=S7VTP6_9FLAO|nr:hypothetical protein [Winogradskyella psychrotolerans]EPR73620.1 hypothetical protein ADIWIN_1257 [Winogradskyella psychrotolerans RS-3]
MTEKDIKREIVNKISQGDSKTVIYNNYKDRMDDENLRRFLATRPSYILWKKFKKSHLLLSIIWAFYLLFELIVIFDLLIQFNIVTFISLLLSIYITINIWKFDGRFFLLGILWFVVTIFRSFNELGSVLINDDYKFVLVFILIYTSILTLGIYLMYAIRKHVFYYIKWFKPILNEEGEVQYE